MIIISDNVNTNTSKTGGLAVNGRNHDFDNKDRKKHLHKIRASVSDARETIKIIFDSELLSCLKVGHATPKVALLIYLNQAYT